LGITGENSLKIKMKLIKLQMAAYVSDYIIQDYDNMIAINELILGLYPDGTDINKRITVEKFYRNNQVRVSKLK